MPGCYCVPHQGGLRFFFFFLGGEGVCDHVESLTGQIAYLSRSAL